MANMNNVQSQKCGYPPEAIEENPVKSEKSRDIFDFHRLLKVPNMEIHSDLQMRKKTNCHADG